MNDRVFLLSLTAVIISGISLMNPRQEDKTFIMILFLANLAFVVYGILQSI